MQQDPRISFRNMEPSPAAEARIRQRVAELMQLSERLTSCTVVVEARHRRQQHGKLYHVRINIGAPEKELVVNRDPHDNHAHEDLHVAIRDAFDAARRQLDDHIRQLRGDVKAHTRTPIEAP